MTNPRDGQSSALGEAFQAVASGSPNAGQAVDAFQQQVQQQVQQSQQIKSAAVAGHLLMKPEAAQAMIKAYQTLLQEWASGESDIRRITDVYLLGSTPGAKAIAPWVQQAAQRLQLVYNQLQGVYRAQIDAYQAAIKNYQENEANVSDSLRKAGER